MRAFALRHLLHLVLLLAATLVALPAVPREGTPTTDLRALPAEAAATLELIRRGGPYPYRRDGVLFQNRERLLPPRQRGYYREFTVPTPGSTHRGARRIVTGGDPPEVFYYTDDHYRSFRQIDPRP